MPPPATQLHSPRFATRTMRRLGEGTKNVIARLGNVEGFARRRDDSGAMNITAVGVIALSIVAVILGAVVGMQVLASLYPTFGGAAGNLSENITTVDLNDPTANSLRPTIAMVVSIAAVLGILGIAVGIFALLKGNKFGGG